MEADMVTKIFKTETFVKKYIGSAEMSYVICFPGDLSVSELACAKYSPDQSLNECNKCWNTSSTFLKPRIFCLEHAVQVVEMLQSKGGANVLIICHSGLFEDSKPVCIIILLKLGKIIY